MPERGLQLALEAGQSLPIHLCWRVRDGYLRAIGGTDTAEPFTLGIWGPGDMVMPDLLSLKPVELRALSTASVQEWNPDPTEDKNCCNAQIQQLGRLLQLTRIRPVDARVFQLLLWLSERFGRSTDRGRLVPLEELNLTHRQLAEMSSLSRVTVTKALGHLRQQGFLERVGELDLLTNAGLCWLETVR